MKGIGCFIALLTTVAVSCQDSSDEVPATRAGRDCNCGWVNKGRIVGGHGVPKNKYPLMASIEDILGFQFCGGSVITPWHVLTAAHCTHDKMALTTKIRVGANTLDFIHREGESYMVSKIINHEAYNNEITANDIALLVTRSKIQFSQIVGPVCLPAGRPNIAGQYVTVIGWGKTQDGGAPAKNLQEVSLRVLSSDECRRYWRIMNPATNLCTIEANKGSCQGDSGGPLLWLNPTTNRYTLVALVSYGGEVCAGPTPTVNTDVGAYMNWINKKVAESKPGQEGTCVKG